MTKLGYFINKSIVEIFKPCIQGVRGQGPDGGLVLVINISAKWLYLPETLYYT
jgi:hypothetical protein